MRLVILVLRRQENGELCNLVELCYKGNGLFVEPRDIQRGDIVLYRFNRTGRTSDHCGIADEVYPTGLFVIEGNTAITNDNNGGAVMRRARDYSYVVGGYRPKYAEDEMTKDEIKTLIREVANEDNPVFADLKDVPDYWREKVAELLESGAIDGSTPNDVSATDTNIRLETLKAAIIAARYVDTTR